MFSLPILAPAPPTLAPLALAAPLAIAVLSGCATPATERAPDTAVSAPAPSEAGAEAGKGQQEPQTELWRGAILDVESKEGESVAVTTNLGSDAVPLEPGAWGLLENGRYPIGWVKVVEVSPGRSRAEIQGRLSEPIAADTKVVVRVRNPGSDEPDPVTPAEDVASSGDAPEPAGP